MYVSKNKYIQLYKLLTFYISFRLGFIDKNLLVCYTKYCNYVVVMKFIHRETQLQALLCQSTERLTQKQQHVIKQCHPQLNAIIPIMIMEFYHLQINCLKK
jgi:hypothetical protein